MGKMERIRSRPSDSQEGWKEGSEDRGGNKTSWADSVDPSAPSSGSMTQYNKSTAPQDYQVKANYALHRPLIMCVMTAVKAK